MSTYKLFYAGYDRDKDVEQIGVSCSNDFIHWSLLDTNPIIPLGFSGFGDEVQTSNPCVIKDGDVYKMWYQGKSKKNVLSIFYSESHDAFHWKHFNKPVLTYVPQDTEIDYRMGVQHPHVICTSHDGYTMWFSLTRHAKTTIGRAVSKNGTDWTIVNEAILVPEMEWEGQHVLYPMVLLDENIYKMWYSGKSKTGKWAVGYAESKDGIEWNKKANPILSYPVAPKIIRRVFEYVCKLVGIECVLPVHGIASVNVWKEHNTFKLLAHEIGTHGKLYIAVHESNDGIHWHKVKNNIFSTVSFKDWDNFFQGDPYIYVEQ